MHFSLSNALKLTLIFSKMWFCKRLAGGWVLSRRTWLSSTSGREQFFYSRIQNSFTRSLIVQRENGTLDSDVLISSWPLFWTSFDPKSPQSPESFFKRIQALSEMCYHFASITWNFDLSSHIRIRAIQTTVQEPWVVGLTLTDWSGNIWWMHFLKI